MNAFLWTMIIIQGLVAVSNALLLAANRLPYTVNRTHAEAVGSLIVSSAFVLWAALLLR